MEERMTSLWEETCDGGSVRSAAATRLRLLNDQLTSEAETEPAKTPMMERDPVPPVVHRRAPPSQTVTRYFVNGRLQEADEPPNSRF